MPNTNDENPEKVFTVHYKHAVDEEPQKSQHTPVQNNDAKCLAQDRRKNVEISKPYAAFRDQFMNSLTENQSIRNGRLSRISVANHRIELLDDNNQPVHSEPYCARPQTHKREKIKTEKVFKDSIIQPARIEWAASIVLALTVDGSLRFCVGYRRFDVETKRDCIQYRV